jgi:cell cycle sensor histidine kinase DivJ
VTLDPRSEPHPLALLGHELRTPLNAMIGYADAMRSEAFGPLPSPYREQAELIHAAASHMLALVDAMAAPNGLKRPLALEPLRGEDLERLLEEVTGLLRPRAEAADLELRLALVAEHSAGLGVEADRVALRQILINLIDNAVKFTPKGGVIELAARRAGDDVQLTVLSAGGAGPGSGGPGRGLGLGLVRALVAAMGGSFEPDVRPGGPSVAIVRLPAAAKV